MAMLRSESTELAIQKFAKLAQAGDGHAAAVMGAVHEYGFAPYPVDLAKALHFYERGETQCGAVEASLGIARIRLGGPMEFRDYGKALSSLTMAAEAIPCPEAHLGIGEIQLKGLGVPVDLAKADSAFELAAAQGALLGYEGRARVAWQGGHYLKSLGLRLEAFRAGMASSDA